MASFSGSFNGSSYTASVASSRSSASVRARAEREHQERHGEDLLDRRSPLENGIFGVLFTLSKENNETRIRIRWTLLKILLDAWQLFTTVISPDKQGWNINDKGTAWVVVSVLNFAWLSDLGYGTYLGVLYSMVVLLMGNVGLCVWVAWCFKEHKFPVVWPIKVLRVFSSVFFQAFDVASLNLLQLGINCNYSGDQGPRLHMSLFPSYSCASTPHMFHAVVSALSLLLFVAIALLLNMAEVEVNPLSRRPLALGHSGAEIMAFAIKVLLTLVDVFIGYKRIAACMYMALSLALAWQGLRRNPHLVAWVNYLKGGVVATILWCCANLMMLAFRPGITDDRAQEWSEFLTLLMLVGLAPAFGCGALTSFLVIRNMTRTALKALATAKPNVRLEDVCENLDDPRDVEVVARCCRVWKDRYTLDADAVNRAHQVIKAGLAMFPNSAYMVLLHGNFMIEVLGVSQSGNSRIEDARKLNPSLMCRFIMFVRRQQATQKAAGNSANDGISMDLLGYVEYQRKQRMVVRLHREALQAMCSFWKALDASKVSFMHLSRALSRIESSVSQAQTAYRVVLENYSHNPKLVRLYGKFLQTIKNDPWRASEYFTEADRLEEIKNGDARGPLLPDGTPLGRMDEMATAVLVINAAGEIQMANRHTHLLFGYKRSTLEGKPLATLLAPHTVRRVIEKLDGLTGNTTVKGTLVTAMSMTTSDGEAFEDVVVGMHYDRLAFPVKFVLRKVSGVGEDSTFVAMMEPVPPVSGVASLWVAPNGTVAACDPQFVALFGWKASDVNGTNLMNFLAVVGPERQAGGDEEAGDVAVTLLDSTVDLMARLLSSASAPAESNSLGHPSASVKCRVAHKYDTEPLSCIINVTSNVTVDIPMLEIRIRLDIEPSLLLVANRKGTIVHASLELVTALKDVARGGGAGHRLNFSSSVGSGLGNGLGVNGGGGGGGGIVQGGISGPRFASSAGAMLSGQAGGTLSGVPGADDLSGFTLFDFLPSPWKDMHTKFLKDSATLSPPGRNQWSCRKATLPGPTLELRTAGGKPLYMTVSVSTTDVSGEASHVIRLASSCLEAALTERRLRLSVTEEGLVSSVSEGSGQLFGLEPGQLVGRGLWEIIKEAAPSDGGRAAASGPDILTALVSRSLGNPDHSWRVLVSPPQKPSKGAMLELAAAARATLVRPAVMQVHMEHVQMAEGGNDDVLNIFVDLWPIASITGVLELDGTGRVRTVLEERIRPAGLLFGMATQSLVGCQLGELLALPPGRFRPGDLLSTSNTKKSSLKLNKKESSLKVGPVHVLQASHADGQPALLDVQVVGKPGFNQPAHAILRFHIVPMLPHAPSVAGVPAGVGVVFTLGGGGGSVMKAPAFNLRASSMARIQSAGTTAMAAAAFGLKVGPLGPGVRLQSPGGLVEPAPVLKGVQSGVVSGSKLLRTDTARTAGGVVGVIPGEQQPPGGRSLSSGRTGAAVLPLEEPVQTGYSVAAAHQGLVGLAAGPPDMLTEGVPLPGVTSVAGKAAHLAGRSKLADMVKSVGNGSGSGSGADDPGDGVKAPPPPRRRGSTRLPPMERLPSGTRLPPVVRLPSGESIPKSPFSKTAGADLDELLMRATTKASAPAVDLQSVGSSHESASEKEARKEFEGTNRISTWVSSKGAYFQNTIKTDIPSDDNRSRRSGDFSDIVPGNGVVARLQLDGFVGPELSTKAPPSPGLRSEFGGYAEDDGASEGGQSALSIQSASGGAEYKRGKRFRKLIKLMDSSQTQQVLQRFRTHALATVTILALVHIVCFALMVTAIQSQRTAMLNLGHSGEAQRYMHQIMIDVRSLDVISSKRKIPDYLYGATDAEMFVNRISVNAEIVKGRLNKILTGHHSSGSQVLHLFFYTQAPAWNGNDINGTDLYTNLTVWDFGTRFYAMATNIVQNYDLWISQGVRINDTAAGQFLLKSGPDLWRMSRQILDSLLYEATDNVHRVDTLQLVFLVVEGLIISSMAALYLAYLLRAVAAQRHKLYGTFLVVPLGLTRALASQNTNLLVDDDDMSDMSDEDERAAGAPEEEAETASGDATKVVKRRATLNVSEVVSPINDGVEGGAARRVLGRSSSSRGVTGGGGGEGLERKASEKFLHQRSMTGDLATESKPSGWRRVLPLRVWRAINRRGRSVVPLPPQTNSLTSVVSLSAITRRKIKDDSHETLVMMTPFVFWSALVITIYAVAVIYMQGVVEVVAIHSVANFMSARTFRAVFFGQELAVVEDPELLSPRREALLKVMKLVRDAWYTLQLGDDAYLAAGPDTEHFPLVKQGLAYASPELSDIFYGTGRCHRMQANLPCLGPKEPFYQVTHTGLDSMMQHFMMSVSAMAKNKSMIPEGLTDEHFNFLYNVGSKDLLDGTVTVEMVHYTTISGLFRRILVLHVVLFLVLWVVFAGFLILLLNPLLKRISKERRRIAELMSQLPLELDVERLVARALGTLTTPGAPGAPAGGLSGGTLSAGQLPNEIGIEAGDEIPGKGDATSKWRAIIRSASNGLVQSKTRSGNFSNNTIGSLMPKTG